MDNLAFLSCFESDLMAYISTLKAEKNKLVLLEKYELTGHLAAQLEALQRVKEIYYHNKEKSIIRNPGPFSP